MDNHPITPSSELINQWETLYFDEEQNLDVVLIQVYQAGADQELEACCEWLQCNDPYEHNYPQMLRSARRPKPPSLKEQALDTLHLIRDYLPADMYEKSFTIRRALEQLDD